MSATILRVRPVRGEQGYRERECVHRARGDEGEFYSGASYVQSLMRLRAAPAAELANRVTSFFWSDAQQIVVWLCRDCASRLDSLRRAD
ncbi:MAG TPA: hypothetical protein VK421_18650 [Pyrinomonadaceae bacterium]|nr:hypothetical protein [Pyrinomonadaceae bacterium]